MSLRMDPGMYIGNNQKPKDGEEKLHLVIEGTSELDVQAGKKEIQRFDSISRLATLFFFFFVPRIHGKRCAERKSRQGRGV